RGDLCGIPEDLVNTFWFHDARPAWKRSPITVRESTPARLTPTGRISAIVWLLTGEGAVEPGLGVGPQAVGRGPSDAQGVGNLLKRQLGEVAQFDQLGLAGVLLGQPVQRLAQGEQFVCRLFLTGRRRVQVESPTGATVLEAAFAACVVNENSPHGFRSS